MNDHSHLYIGTAFAAGILLTIGFKQLIQPELQRVQSKRPKKQFGQSNSKAHPVNSPDDDTPIARPGPPAIVDGIEGCIGNTPLFRIKSLSEKTGCEILAKAEVCVHVACGFGWIND